MLFKYVDGLFYNNYLSMNNEEDVKKSADGDNADGKLPTINGNRNQFFDLDDFNSDDKDHIKNDDNNEDNLGHTTPKDK